MKCIPIDSASFALSVTQDGAANPPITKVFPYDTLTIFKHRFVAGGLLSAAGDKVIHDRVAPVVVSAKARVSAGNAAEAAHDTLSVKFSEPVAISVTAAELKPFTFLRRNASGVVEFTPTFSLCSPAAPSNFLSFAVVDFNHPSIDRFMENDSLGIATSADWIGDTVNPPNYQRHIGNSRQALSLDSAGPPPREFFPFPGNGAQLRVRAQSSGQVKLTVFSLTGRRMRESTISVQKDQWISVRLRSAVHQRPIVRGLLLFTLSLGNMHMRGFIHAAQSKLLEMNVGE
jgi:hypothetical protein